MQSAPSSPSREGKTPQPPKPPIGSSAETGSLVTQEGFERRIEEFGGQLEGLLKQLGSQMGEGFNGIGKGVEGVMGQFGEEGSVGALRKKVEQVDERVVKRVKPKVGQDPEKTYRGESLLRDLSDEAEEVIKKSGGPKKLAALANDVKNPNTGTNEGTVLSQLTAYVNKMGGKLVLDVIQGGQVTMKELSQSLKVDEKDQQAIEDALFKHFVPKIKAGFMAVVSTDVTDGGLAKKMESGIDEAFKGIDFEFSKVKTWFKNSGRYTFFLGALLPSFKGTEYIVSFMTMVKTLVESKVVSLETLLGFVKQYGLEGFFDFAGSFISLETAFLIGGGIMLGFFLDWMWEKWSTVHETRTVPRTHIGKVKA